MNQLSTSGPGITTFFEWMRQHQLGRKRILDTMLAATFQAEGVRSVLTTKAKDFGILGEFVCVSP